MAIDVLVDVSLYILGTRWVEQIGNIVMARIDGFLQLAPAVNGSVTTFINTRGLVCSFVRRNSTTPEGEICPQAKKRILHWHDGNASQQHRTNAVCVMMLTRAAAISSSFTNRAVAGIRSRLQLDQTSLLHVAVLGRCSIRLKREVLDRLGKVSVWDARWSIIPLRSG